jgi:hypothetical protein
MPLEVITTKDFEAFSAPILAEFNQMREELAYYRVLLKDHQWIRREEAQEILGIGTDTLLRNRDEWNIRYRKGKRYIDYWLPDIWKYLKEEKRLKPAEIERRIQVAIAA